MVLSGKLYLRMVKRWLISFVFEILVFLWFIQNSLRGQKGDKQDIKQKGSGILKILK